MDWNWFFSSLSQSAAAIVGIFGAFIITKILSNQATFSEKNNRLKQLIADAQKIEDDAGGLYFNWCNKHTTARELEKVADLIEDQCDDSAAELYEKMNFSPFVERDVAISAINALIQKNKERVEREAEEQRRRLEILEQRKKLKERGGVGSLLADIHGFGSGLGADSAIFTPKSALRIPSTSNISSELTNERDSIEGVIRNAKHHMRQISNFLDSVAENPESSPQITYSLALVAILFFVGVIYPLSFMPQPVGAKIELSAAEFIPLLFSLKGALLFSISIVFTTALSMFFAMNIRMKYPIERVAELKRFGAITAYSKFFSIMTENQEARRNRAHDSEVAASTQA